MDAREYYFNALINKQTRDAQNPILDAASAGWKGGIDNELARRKSIEDLTLKQGIESAQKTKQQKIDFMKDAWMKYDHFITDKGTRRLASPKESMDAFNLAIEGKDYPGMESVLKKTEYSPEETERGKLRAQKEFGVLKPPKDETIANLNIAYDNLIAQKNTLLRRKDSQGNIDQDSIDLIDQQLLEIQNKISGGQGLGTIESETVPGSPAVPKKTVGDIVPIFKKVPALNPSIPFTGRAATPDTTRMAYKPFSGQPAPVAPPVQVAAPAPTAPAAAPVMPVSQVKPQYQVGQVLNTPKGQVKIVGFDSDGTPLIEVIGR